MRKITQNAANAFLAKGKFKESNTEVRINPLTQEIELLLHDNVIATRKADGTGRIKITNCGWFTPTTKERLNALPNVQITQKKGVWYLNGEIWDGEPKYV